MAGLLEELVSKVVWKIDRKEVVQYRRDMVAVEKDTGKALVMQARFEQAAKDAVAAQKKRAKDAKTQERARVTAIKETARAEKTAARDAIRAAAQRHRANQQLIRSQARLERQHKATALRVYSARVRAATRETRRLTAAKRASARESAKMNAGIRSTASSLGGFITRVGLTTVAVSSLVGVALGASIIKTASAFEGLRAMLETTEKSAEKAANTFDKIKVFAKQTPFDVEGVTNAYIRLKNIGLDPSMKALRAYGNIASSVGNAEQSLTTRFSKFVEAVADATQNNWKRLREFGIRGRIEGDKAVFMFKGLESVVDNNASAIEAHLQKLAETNFGGAMARQMETAAGKMSNLGDVWRSFQDNVGQAGGLEAWKTLLTEVEALIAGDDGGVATAISDILVDAITALRGEFRDLTASNIREFFRVLRKDIQDVIRVGRDLWDVLKLIIKAGQGLIDISGGVDNALAVMAGGFIAMRIAAAGALGPIGGILIALAAAIPLAIDAGEALGEFLARKAGFSVDPLTRASSSKAPSFIKNTEHRQLTAQIAKDTDIANAPESFFGTGFRKDQAISRLFKNKKRVKEIETEFARTSGIKEKQKATDVANRSRSQNSRFLTGVVKNSRAFRNNPVARERALELVKQRSHAGDTREEIVAALEKLAGTNKRSKSTGRSSSPASSTFESEVAAASKAKGSAIENAAILRGESAAEARRLRNVAESGEKERFRTAQRDSDLRVLAELPHVFASFPKDVQAALKEFFDAERKRIVRLSKTQSDDAISRANFIDGKISSLRSAAISRVARGDTSFIDKDRSKLSGSQRLIFDSGVLGDSKRPPPTIVSQILTVHAEGMTINVEVDGAKSPMATAQATLGILRRKVGEVFGEAAIVVAPSVEG